MALEDPRRHRVDRVPVGDVAQLDLAAELGERSSPGLPGARRARTASLLREESRVASPIPDDAPVTTAIRRPGAVSSGALGAGMGGHLSEDAERVQVDLDRVADVLGVAAGERHADRDPGLDHGVADEARRGRRARLRQRKAAEPVASNGSRPRGRSRAPAGRAGPRGSASSSAAKRSSVVPSEGRRRGRRGRGGTGSCGSR